MDNVEELEMAFLELQRDGLFFLFLLCFFWFAQCETSVSLMLNCMIDD